MQTEQKTFWADGRRHPLFRERGMVEIFALFLIFVLLILIHSVLFFNRTAYQMSETVDRIRQGSNDRTTLERHVREAVLAKAEVTPATSTASVADLLDSLLAGFNATASGITLSRSGAMPDTSAVTARMFPSASIPLVGTPNLSITGDSFQTKRLIRKGVAVIGGPLNFQFLRTISSNSNETKTITVQAQPLVVSMSNWAFIAYGLPGSAAVPAAAPSGAGGILGSGAFVSNDGAALILTPLRPSPSYSGGDPTAFDHLYSPPLGGQPESLPSFYRQFDSLAWRAWDFIWAGGVWPLTTYNAGFYQDRLLNYAQQPTRNTGAVRSTGALLDLTAFAPAPISGVVVTGSTVTIDLGAYPEDILFVVDGAGGSTISLIGAGTNARGPLVIVVSNQSNTASSINYSGTNNRTTLIYSRHCINQFAGGTVFAGGIYLDRRSQAVGTIVLDGIFAYYGATANNPFPSLALTLTPPTGALLADLRVVAPRALLISTTSSTN